MCLYSSLTMVPVSLLFACVAFFVASVASEERHVVDTLLVSNGIEDGEWKIREFCHKGTYAISFDLLVSKKNIHTQYICVCVYVFRCMCVISVILSSMHDTLSIYIKDLTQFEK